MRRIVREGCGTVVRIPPVESGALAQCAFCQWGRFFPDRKRKHWNAVDRAAAALRGHAKRSHADRFVHVTTAEEFSK